MRVYRVTVRGPFKDLTSQTRAWLHASADEHGIFLSSFTPEGTFTYDKQLDAFNLRYEVRLADDNPSDGTNALTTADASTTPHDPSGIALAEASMFLQTMGIGHGALRAAVMDMNAMTARGSRTERTRRARRSETG